MTHTKHIVLSGGGILRFTYGRLSNTCQAGDIRGRCCAVQEDVLPVTVHVLDVNDNNPVFSADVYMFTCQNEPGTVGAVKVLLTRDLDLEFSGCFRQINLSIQLTCCIIKLSSNHQTLDAKHFDHSVIPLYNL